MTNEQMVKCIRDGESRLLEKLIDRNQGMIHKTIKNYMGYVDIDKAVDYEDLYQAAVLGIIEAVPEWETSRGMFMTLATFYMRRSIRRALGIATSKRTVDSMPTVSLFAPINELDDISLVDTIADTSAVDPVEEAELSDMRRIVREAVESLPESQYMAIQHWINGGDPLGTSREQLAAKKSLRKNKALIKMWEMCKSVPYHHIGYKTYKTTFTSTVEAAAIYREEWWERINALIDEPDGDLDVKAYKLSTVAG